MGNLFRGFRVMCQIIDFTLMFMDFFCLNDAGIIYGTLLPKLILCVIPSILVSIFEDFLHYSITFLLLMVQAII
jgi:hypothetical protein